MKPAPGSVIFDDAALDGPSPAPATIVGTVTSSLSTPVQGATVEKRAGAALTGSGQGPTRSEHRSFAIDGYCGHQDRVRAPRAPQSFLVPGSSTTVDFVLDPDNLLANPGFETPPPYVEVAGT